jgi:membrane-associated phospholipid phosphatase
MNSLIIRFLWRVFFMLFVVLLALPNGQLQANSLQKAGDALQFVVPAYAFGLAMREETNEGIKQFAYSLISSQVTVHVLKKVTNQKRPCFKEGDKKNSFPSGHTSSAFAGATFVHKR